MNGNKNNFVLAITVLVTATIIYIIFIKPKLHPFGCSPDDPRCIFSKNNGLGCSPDDPRWIFSKNILDGYFQKIMASVAVVMILDVYLRDKFLSYKESKIIFYSFIFYPQINNH